MLQLLQIELDKTNLYLVSCVEHTQIDKFRYNFEMQQHFFCSTSGYNSFGQSYSPVYCTWCNSLGCYGLLISLRNCSPKSLRLRIMKLS